VSSDQVEQIYSNGHNSKEIKQNITMKYFSERGNADHLPVIMVRIGNNSGKARLDEMREQCMLLREIGLDYADII
jgi:hypothetical protein